MTQIIIYRGRPRALSVDQDPQIPKKRKKKRQPKYMDEEDNELSDLSNPDDEAVHLSSNTATVNNAIVTCTVTTGLTSPNGVNNGGSSSKVGFTISIPSSSLTSPLTTLTSQNGTTSTSKTAVSKTDKAESAAAAAAAKDIKLALVAHDDHQTVQDVDENYDDC